MRRCPQCQVPMRTVKLASVDVDQCPNCQGLWLKDEELRLAKDHVDEDLVWLDFEIWKHPEKFLRAESKLKCPDDGADLVRLTYDETRVTVDYCTSCRGVWVQKGEFQRIIQALENEIISKNVGEYIKASLQEAKDLLTGPESFPAEWRDVKAVLKLLQMRFSVEHKRLMDAIIQMPWLR